MRDLLGRVAGRLRKTAWHMCHDHHEAQDLCQEALLHLSRATVLHSYRGEGPLDGYLMSVGVRRMISARRGRAFKAWQAVDLFGEPDGGVVGASHTDVTTPRALDPRLAGALRALPERARTVVVLIAVGELSYEECAAAAGMPVGTVRSTYSRARAFLRRELGGLGQEAGHGMA